MITTTNYFNRIGGIDLKTLPEAIGKGHEFVVKATSNGTSWDAYHSSDAIKKTIDLYLVKLNEFTGKRTQPEKPKKNHAAASKSNKKAASPRIKEHPGHNTDAVTDTISLVERIPDELRFIRRFLNLNGKTKTKDEILRFINSLQKAIVEKRIRKTSAYAEHIKYIQTRLIDTYNGMGSRISIEIKPDTYDFLKQVSGQEKLLTSIGFIKRYISLNGRSGMKEKAKNLIAQIKRAVEKGKLPDNDPYSTEIYEIKKNLRAFIDNKAVRALAIETATLNGLEGILGCACDSKKNKLVKPTVMNSLDFANMQFQTIGLQGKWNALIGDPSRNFTAMVFGKPKMGKSYLCIDFAGYLARNHGKVMYVAKEEGLDYTLQQKLNDKDVAHPNLFVASVLPESLASYDFIFLDSVNKLGLNPEDLNRLKHANPTKSFVFVFQSTKGGHFRGANTFQHDVDIVIEVPEKGRAVQMGRFNQGGEIRIFDSYPIEA